MKPLLKTLNLLLCVFLFTSQFGFSQEIKTDPNAPSHLKKAAREIMTAAGICALISLDDEGRARARAMDAFLPEEDFVVWFGTNANSRKVAQIKNDPRVTLYYLDEDASGYVMLYGHAELIDNPADKKKYWKKAWEAFYPENRDNYLLIKVSPTWMEVSSAPRGIHGDTFTWQPPILEFDTK